MYGGDGFGSIRRVFVGVVGDLVGVVGGVYRQDDGGFAGSAQSSEARGMLPWVSVVGVSVAVVSLRYDGGIAGSDQSSEAGGLQSGVSVIGVVIMMGSKIIGSGEALMVVVVIVGSQFTKLCTTLPLKHDWL